MRRTAVFVDAGYLFARVRVHLVGVRPARGNQSLLLLAEADTTKELDAVDLEQFPRRAELRHLIRVELQPEKPSRLRDLKPDPTGHCLCCCRAGLAPLPLIFGMHSQSSGASPALQRQERRRGVFPIGCGSARIRLRQEPPAIAVTGALPYADATEMLRQVANQLAQKQIPQERAVLLTMFRADRRILAEVDKQLLTSARSALQGTELDTAQKNALRKFFIEFLHTLGDERDAGSEELIP